jgi:hypothetical protein
MVNHGDYINTPVKQRDFIAAGGGNISTPEVITPGAGEVDTGSGD